MTHLGKTSLEALLKRYYYFPNLTSLCAMVAAQCLTCARNNAAPHPQRFTGVQHRGRQPFEDLQIDFTEVKPSRGYKYLLVLICTFSGWVEAFPTRTEKSREVVKVLLREIIPRFGLPMSIGSDNGPAFVAKVIQKLAGQLRITWKLHTACRPQRSGKVERVNQTLKETLAKFHQETDLPWPDLLPLVLSGTHPTPQATPTLS